MKVNKQFQKVQKEYVLSWEDLREKFGIKEKIDHVYHGNHEVVLVTKWKKTDKERGEAD